MSTFTIRGRIIDGISDTALEDGLVVVEGDRIGYVGKETDHPLPPDAMSITIENGTILPGFIDCHAHLVGDPSGGGGLTNLTEHDRLLNAAADLKILLDAGFTSIRDMSAFGPALRRAVDRGALRGPHIMPGGKVLSPTAGHVDHVRLPIDVVQNHSLVGYLVDGVDECLKGVRMQFREGAEFIKICATGGVSSIGDELDDVQFSEEELRVIVAEAARHGTYVAAHCSGTAGTYQALCAGVGCIEHGIALDERCIEIMIKKNIPLVTTLYVSMLVADSGLYPEHMTRKAKIAARSHVKSLMMARDAGIRIALGTDFSNSKNTPYAGNGREFVSIVKAGFTPMEAIKIGTINGAHVMKRASITGSLERGKLADIVVVKGNPLDDISLLAHADNIKVVLKGGVLEKHSV